MKILNILILDMFLITWSAKKGAPINGRQRSHSPWRREETPLYYEKNPGFELFNLGAAPWKKSSTLEFFPTHSECYFSPLVNQSKTKI
jgi:hypothetical protein